MATNLVSLAMQFLTPDIIRRIAAALGLDRSSAQTAISAAIPSLLAGFSGLSAQPGGAQQLTDAVSQQTGTLEGFARMLGGATNLRSLNRDRRSFRRCWVANSKERSREQLAGLPESARVRRSRCSGCWHRLSWARSGSSKERRASIQAGSPVFSPARRTTLPQRCPRV